MASRSERLLALIQALRRHRRPVTARQLATELSVSVRTIYRDIETLVAQGASIAGEAGVGFVKRPGFMLPPLMFRDEEIEPDADRFGLLTESDTGRCYSSPHDNSKHMRPAAPDSRSRRRRSRALPSLLG